MPLFRKKKVSSEPIPDPPRKANRKRSERLCIGLTEEEKKCITAAAKSAGMTRTDYILNSVKGTRIIVISGLNHILTELVREGTILNQLTRHVNALNRVSQKDVQETCRACQNTYRKLAQFIDCWDIKLRQEGGNNADTENVVV